jgi:hypothetical protein
LFCILSTHVVFRASFVQKTKRTEEGKKNFFPKNDHTLYGVSPILLKLTIASSFRPRRKGQPLDDIPSIGPLNDTEGAPALYVNQQIARIYRANRDKAIAGVEGMNTTAFPLRLNNGLPVTEKGKQLRAKVAYFEEPYIEVTRLGYLFDTYKGRWARHITSLVTKLAVELDLFTVMAIPGLYRCPGTPG